MTHFNVKTTKKEELIDITAQVKDEVEKSRLKEGLCVVFVPHTTAALFVNEGADPDVAKDILEHLREIVPDRKIYRHTEGNAPAHIKSALLGQSKTFLIKDGALFLGRWQSIFFCEFDGPRERKVYIFFK